VVGRRRAPGREEAASLRERVEEGSERGDGRAVHASQAVARVRPLRRRDPEQRVGTEARDDRAIPARVPDRLVLVERVGRGVGRGEHFDVEAIEQGAWEELRRLQFLGDLVIDAERRVRRELDAHAEQVVQLVVEPGAGRRSAEEMAVDRERRPHLARMARGRGAVPRRDA
jgi:hypothetical protein